MRFERGRCPGPPPLRRRGGGGEGDGGSADEPEGATWLVETGAAAADSRGRRRSSSEWPGGNRSVIPSDQAFTVVLATVCSWAWLPSSRPSRHAYVLRAFPAGALFHARRDRVVPLSPCRSVVTVPFVWRGHAKRPTTRAGLGLDTVLRLGKRSTYSAEAWPLQHLRQPRLSLESLQLRHPTNLKISQEERRQPFASS